MLTLLDCTKLLGLQPGSVTNLRKDIKAGILRATRYGHQYFVTPEDLEAYQEFKRTKPRKVRSDKKT